MNVVEVVMEGTKLKLNRQPERSGESQDFGFQKPAEAGSRCASLDLFSIPSVFKEVYEKNEGK